MAGLIDALILGKHSLMANTLAMSTTGHNVANVNTPGYTRQKAIFEAGIPLETIHGFIGMGVQISDINRYRDDYLDRQVLIEKQNNGFLDFQNTSLAQVEAILGETSGYGISGILEDFWSAWSDVANDPESHASRIPLQQKAAQLTVCLNNMTQELRNHQLEIDYEVKTFVDEINQKAELVGSMNKTISQAMAQGQSMNDLMDQRDLLIDELAELANITVVSDDNGVKNVWLGGDNLVYHEAVQELDLVTTGTVSDQLNTVIWKATGNEANFQSGKLGGILYVRDAVIPELQGQLDQFALGLVSNINQLHVSGYGLDGSTGNYFFDYNTTGAGNIALSTQVLNDVNKIAASSDGSAGNGTVALNIYNLQNDLVMESGTETLTGFYAAIVTDLGAIKQNGEVELMESETALTQLENWKSSVESVSLDEEMARLIQYQQSYNALAHFMTITREMLSKVMNID